jgi:hypothetical protein
LLDKTERYIKEIRSILSKYDVVDSSINSYVNGKIYYIFDCKQPSFFKSPTEKVVLKNHIINHMLKRKEYPGYNDTDGYICSKDTDYLWRTNPVEDATSTHGYIAFDASKPEAADQNLMVMKDKIGLQRVFNEVLYGLERTDITRQLNKKSDQLLKVIDKIMYIRHHPQLYGTKNPKITTLDILAEAENHNAPKWVKHLRRNLRKILVQKVEKLPLKHEFKVNLERVLGDGFDSIIYNCSTPKYLKDSYDDNVNKSAPYQLDKYYRLLLKKIGKCDAKEEVWRDPKSDHFLMYNHKIGAQSAVIPNSFFTTINDGSSEVCTHFMKYFKHPSFYYKHYKPSKECSNLSPKSKSNSNSDTNSNNNNNNSNNDKQKYERVEIIKIKKFKKFYY